VEIELTQVWKPSLSLGYPLQGNNHALTTPNVPIEKGYVFRYTFRIIWNWCSEDLLNNCEMVLILYCYLNHNMSFEVFWTFHLALPILKFDTKGLNLVYIC